MGENGYFQEILEKGKNGVFFRNVKIVIFCHFVIFVKNAKKWKNVKNVDLHKKWENGEK